MFLQVSFGQSFWLAWFRVYIWYIPGSFHVSAHISWPRWTLPKRPMSIYCHLASLPFDLQGDFLRMCSQRSLLTSRVSNMWSLFTYLGRAQPPLSIFLLFSSWSIGPQRTNSDWLCGGSSISCLTRIILWEPLLWAVLFTIIICCFLVTLLVTLSHPFYMEKGERQH